MKIPVFVSRPTWLNPAQEKSRQVIMELLEDLNVEPRTLGSSDYPSELPLREVLVIARHCAGGVILGFEQFRATAGTHKHGIKDEGIPEDKRERELKASEVLKFPSPWNQLEAGILFGLGVPLLIFREKGIEGGVFDNGVTDVFIHAMPTGTGDVERGNLKEVFLKWYSKASARYFG